MSSWIPPRASSHIEAYLDRVRAQATALPPLYFDHNLSPEERHALRSLAQDDSLVIKSADKGSGIVVEDRSGYVEAGLEHLADASRYQKTPPPKAINTYVQCMADKGIIDDITRGYLTFPDDKPPRTQQLYFLKKTHSCAPHCLWLQWPNRAHLAPD